MRNGFGQITQNGYNQTCFGSGPSAPCVSNTMLLLAALTVGAVVLLPGDWKILAAIPGGFIVYGFALGEALK